MGGTLKFYKLIPSARMPVRADRSALGTLPTAAHMHCEAATSASGIGWYAFSPIDFTVIWRGLEVIWTYDGADAWYPLRTAQFPNFSRSFDENAPESLQGCAPPFLSCTAQPGLLQLWTGLLVRSERDWATLVRPLVNYPPSSNYMLFEGLIETDSWFGPLFTNLVLTRRDEPISFGTEMPLFQVQAVPRVAHEGSVSCECVEEPFSLSPEEWSLFERSVVRRSDGAPKAMAEYAANVRRRRRSGIN